MVTTFRDFLGKRRASLVVCIVLTGVALATISGCSADAARLGLSPYYNDVVGALPAGSPASASARALFSGGPNTELSDVLFSESTEAVVSIPYGIAMLDGIIGELNTGVSGANEADGDGVTVAASPDITLPFFGGTVDVDYEVELGGGKKAAYKISSEGETVVLYNTYDYSWTAVDPAVAATDHYVFHANRTTAGVITIRFALFAHESGAPSTYVKDWAAEITVDENDNFSVSSVWGGIDEATRADKLSGSLAAAGNRTGGFGYRYLDVANAQENQYLVNSDLTEATWNVTTFNAYSVRQLKAVEGDTATLGMDIDVVVDETGRPKGTPFTAAW